MPEVPADPSGGVEGGGGALKRSEAALLPQGRQHSRRGPASIRRRRTSRLSFRSDRSPRTSPVVSSCLSSIWSCLSSIFSIFCPRSEIDRDLLLRLIDKIMVGQKIEMDGVLQQSIIIVYNFVGALD